MELHWVRANRRRWEWHGFQGHLTCLDCEYLEVAGQPNRRCSKGLVELPWFCSAETELREEYGDSGETGLTQADACGEFVVCQELPPQMGDVLVVWYEERMGDVPDNGTLVVGGEKHAGKEM